MRVIRISFNDETAFAVEEEHGVELFLGIKGIESSAASSTPPGLEGLVGRITPGFTQGYEWFNPVGVGRGVH